MGGKTSQRKGAAGERELATILQQHGYDCSRGGSLTFGDLPDVSGLPGIHIEVKRVEKLNVVEAMEQSIRDSERMRDGIPALFHRRNRKPWLVTMRLIRNMMIAHVRITGTSCASSKKPATGADGIRRCRWSD